MKALAPLVVFAYNRPDHLQKTLKALSENELAKDSDLYIFIDGPKTENGIEANSEVEQVSRLFQNGFFRKVSILNHIKNQGLAKSIISGVTDIIDRYGKVIVTEDDSVSDHHYLTFMNEALDYYSSNDKVFSVGGYSLKVDFPPEYHDDVYFTQRSSSVAWGTWKDRWDRIDWDVLDYNAFRFNFLKRRQFNRWGMDRSSMLDDQMNKRINSWAIRFDYSMFKSGMYNVFPRESLIINIGNDGSGTNTSDETTIENKFKITEYSKKEHFAFTDVTINEAIRKDFASAYKVKSVFKIKRFFGNLFYKCGNSRR